MFNGINVTFITHVMRQGGVFLMRYALLLGILLLVYTLGTQEGGGLQEIYHDTAGTRKRKNEILKFY